MLNNNGGIYLCICVCIGTLSFKSLNVYLYFYFYFLADANESRKRKLKQVEETRQSQSHAQEILNIVAPFKSFTAMLTEADSSILTPNVQSLSVQVDHMINTHVMIFLPFSFFWVFFRVCLMRSLCFVQNENLRRGLAGMWGKHYNALQCSAEERVAEKLKEKEMEMIEKVHQNEKLEATLLSYRGEARRLLDRNKELEEMVSNYRAEADSLSSRLMAKEQLLMSLRAALRTATSAHPYQDRQEEDAESSYVDPEQDFSVKLKCKICESRLAMVMLWPCSHVCICTRCESTTRSCPVCRTLATTSARVHLPLN
ncbi:E3 ubiquitin-protein ligase BOI-like isoform X1 [Olea europaea var. sylvestris]|uniref:E3 ubiquitin-protein ligase BOI-like isoform X1 n=1 Tax=Olea europaea var. sylvestris TaxID=158386 RepID=UPI000C1D58A8|nr:E3 ubiquitin-protein ligase BOI-like isoform X1 [Olea europaea var. sylvestris]